MKITVVPAQVTTVEDRIMGNLGLSQLVLLVAPIFIGGGLYALLPPVMDGDLYKYIALGLTGMLCCVLAIRIKGKLVAQWLLLIMRYNLRPRFYVFNKNSVVHREEYLLPRVTKTNQNKPVRQTRTSLVPRLTVLETTQVLTTIHNPETSLIFETTKTGGLHVRFTKIED